MSLNVSWRTVDRSTYGYYQHQPVPAGCHSEAMNQLRAWLYGYDPSSRPRLRNNSTNDSGMAPEQVACEQNETETKFETGVTESSLKQAILKVVPLTPGDCLECKLVGSGVMMLSGIIVMTSVMTSLTKYRQTAPKKVPLSGPRKNLYYAVCGGLFLAFETAAICRLFDLGPFAKHKDQAEPT